MGFLFISYSSKDRPVVELLVTELSRRQLDFWYDRRIENGNRWAQAIQERVRECTVFVPVVTPAFEASEWCERELQLAERLRKPMAPLLRTGEMPMPLINKQYEDVTDGGPPCDAWFTALAVQLADGEKPASGTPTVADPGPTVPEPTDDAPAAPSSTKADQPGTEGTTSTPPPVPAQPSRDAARPRRAALFDALQRPSTLLCVTGLGLALIYFFVLASKLGFRALSLGIAVLVALATATCFVVNYLRSARTKQSSPWEDCEESATLEESSVR
jgi:hypothetical protein